MLGRILTGNPVVTSAKGLTGHLLGAAGAVEAALSALAVERSLIPPTTSLSVVDPRLDLNLAIAAA